LLSRNIHFSARSNKNNSVHMLILLVFLASACATCLLSGCTLNAQCSTCKTSATHDIWTTYDVSFICNSTTTSCMPNFSSGNASSTVIISACRDRASSCCIYDDGPTQNNNTCNLKTCNVHTGCLPFGQCNVPISTNYRSDRTNCCQSTSGCPSTPTLCNEELCISNSCIPTIRFPNCCDNLSQCADSSTVLCMQSACLPDPLNVGFKSCQTGIDTNCACTSSSDCNDGSICSTNTCDLLSNRCTSTYFSGSGGSSCCATDAGASATCSNGDLCRNILGCKDQSIFVNSSMTFLPTFSCIAKDEQSIGCCTASSQCSTLSASSGSPCVSSTCGFGDNTCNTLTSYFSTVSNETLPCCKDSFQDCEPTGQDAQRCNYLKCNNPVSFSPTEQTYFTCTRETLPFTCVSTGVIETNAKTQDMAIEGNCSWACAQPNSNIIRLIAKIANPSSGPNFASPLYLYNVTVRVQNNLPLLSGIVSSISLVPVVPYFPPTRFLDSSLFAIIQDATEIGGVYRQEFSLNDPISMPIYPNEELTVEITIVLRTNATLLASTKVFLDVEPYDICTPALAAGGVPGIDGTPCNIALLPPSGHLGNILPRTVATGATVTISFPSNCSTPCSIVGTTTSNLSPTPTSTKTTNSRTTVAPPTVTVAPPSAGHSVSGMAFYDLNGDGFNNAPTEPPAKNIRIDVQSASNVSDFKTTITNSLGEYTFSVAPTTSYYLAVFNATIPFGYQPTIVVNSNLSPRKNQFFAGTLRTNTRSAGFDYTGMDLGLAKIPPCARATPPPGPSGELEVRFTSSQTTCVECGSLTRLKSKCNPQKCAGSTTRQFIEVETTVSNTGSSPRGANTLLLRLNSIGVGPLEADKRAYICAEAFEVSSTNSYALDSFVSQTPGTMATLAYGWNTIAVGTNVVRVRSQFVYCANDFITHFNITAEILDDSCLAKIRRWNSCDQTIDIRTCQATLDSNIPSCSGCPVTAAPTPSPADHTNPPPTQLTFSVQPYCFDPLCVNSNTFTQMKCKNVTTEMQQCTAAVNRGEILHQTVLTNPSLAPPSEPGSIVIKYRRFGRNDEQLVCGDKYGDSMAVFVLLESFDQNNTRIVNKNENPLTQSLEFAVDFPSIPAGGSVRISLLSYECSAYPLNFTYTARLLTERCVDETLCTKTAVPMPSLASCLHYSLSGCSEIIDGVLEDEFGVVEEIEEENSDLAAPYIIIGIMLILLIAIFCVTLVVLKRRRSVDEMRQNKRLIANKNMDVQQKPFTTSRRTAHFE